MFICFSRISFNGVFTAAFLSAVLVGANGSEPPFLNETIHFENGSISLDAVEEQKIIVWQSKVRDSRWCPIRSMGVTGLADASEGPLSRELAEKRAALVKAVLVANGGPASFIWAVPLPGTEPLVWLEATGAYYNEAIGMDGKHYCPQAYSDGFPLP